MMGDQALRLRFNSAGFQWKQNQDRTSATITAGNYSGRWQELVRTVTAGNFSHGWQKVRATLSGVNLSTGRHRQTALIRRADLSMRRQSVSGKITGVIFPAVPQGRTQATGEVITGDRVGSLSGDCETETTHPESILCVRYFRLGGVEIGGG
jgi:hypothetical protein